MRGETTEKAGIVPFAKFFAVFGFALFSLLLILFLLEISSGVFLSAYWNYWHSPLRRLQVNSPPNQYACRGTGSGGCPVFADVWDMLSASPAYDGYSWAEDFWKEFRAYIARDLIPPYEPFRLWGMWKTQGQYINVDDTAIGRVRRTVNRLRPGCDNQTTVKVWFFGGSTAFGSVPDFATIPSYLSEKLNDQGAGCVEVINLGVPAYNTNQELIYLIQELKAGRPPNAVIFYDGINDAVIGALEPALASTHASYIQIKAKFESPVISLPGLAARSHAAQLAAAVRHRLLKDLVPRRSQDQYASLAHITLDNYESNIQLARRLGKAYGFEVYAFWQPNLLYGNKPLGAFEKMLVSVYGYQTAACRAVYEEAEGRSTSAGNFVFLGRLFEAVSGPIFIDWAHVGPRGDEIVADAMARVVSSTSLLHTGKHSPVPAR